jgi:hypothetical protein
MLPRIALIMMCRSRSRLEMSPAGRAEYADLGQQFGKGFWIRLDNQTSYIVTSATIDIHVGTGDRWLRRRAKRFSVAASLVGHPGDGWCADEGSKATPIYSNYIARN